MLMGNARVFTTEQNLDLQTDALKRAGGFAGRVDLGGRPPRPPTDPDVRVKRIWLFIS